MCHGCSSDFLAIFKVLALHSKLRSFYFCSSHLLVSPVLPLLLSKHHHSHCEFARLFVLLQTTFQPAFTLIGFPYQLLDLFASFWPALPDKALQGFDIVILIFWCFGPFWSRLSTPCFWPFGLPALRYLNLFLFLVTLLDNWKIL